MIAHHAARIRNVPAIVVSAVFALSVFGVSESVRADAKLWQVTASEHNLIRVDTGNVIRTAFERDDFFGINVNYLSFQRQIWDENNGVIRGDIEEHLGKMAGVRYRYPGGMVANGYNWKGAVGAVKDRQKHKNFYGKDLTKPIFGLDEYLDLMDRVGGRFWYVLNLVGLDPANPFEQSSAAEVAASNAELVSYLLENERYESDTHYFQLGNELDRSKHEWTYDNYISQSRATMDAIKKVDPSAKFVAFLRAFAYNYRKDKSRGKSSPEELMKTVLTALPEIEDYSLMQYYDSTRTDGKSWSIPFWAQRIARTIDNYRALKGGAAPRVWITEHARQASTNKPGSDDSYIVTSNLGGAMSSADYLSMLVQIPEVAGAFWHGLNAGPWRLFDANVDKNDLSPRPVYTGLNLLRDASLSQAYATHVNSRNDSGYHGGYDIRATAFGDADGTLSMWIVNRNTAKTKVDVEIADWAKSAATITHRFMAGREGVSPDDPANTLDIELQGTILNSKFSDSGRLTLELPPASISTYTFKRGG